MGACWDDRSKYIYIDCKSIFAVFQPLVKTCNVILWDEEYNDILRRNEIYDDNSTSFEFFF